MPCKSCRNKQKQISKINQPVEMTSSGIIEERMKYSEDLIQPYRDGKVSKEYIEKYGTDRIKADREEIRTATNVWDDLNYYKK
jgi:hypothetical protein